MVSDTQKQGSLNIFDDEFDVSLAIEELSNINKNDQWSEVIERERPVDSMHPSFTIG